MGRFAKGLLTGAGIGGAVGIFGLSYALRDKRSRKKLARDGRKIMHKTNDIIDNITDMF
ncbi:hypothetical protein FACS189490_05840 [Clostridia bacterium]|nr:hypothetical protein FACS189490_05840 [Clostridia bacterium]